VKIFQKLLHLSLRAKLTLLIESFVVILVVSVGLLATMHVKKALENELSKRGLALATDLAQFMTRPLLSNDLPALRRFINHSMEQDYVLYVYVLDPDGRVIMHSDLSEVGKVYKDPVSITAMKAQSGGYTDLHSSDKEHVHCDMYMPIQVSGTRLGTVRFGYSHLAIEREIADAQRNIFLMGLITIIIGGGVSYLLATLIATPIKQITTATEKVSNGHLDTSLPIKRNDEIGVLANAFNKMTEDLRMTTVSKDYVDNIIGSMNDTLIVIGPDAKIMSVNKATCDLLGYREDDLIGKEITQIIPMEGRIFRESGFHEILGKETVANYELEYVRKSGELIPMLFSAAVLRNKQGAREGVVCIARDISEQKLADKIVRESEQKYRTLFEESKDVIYFSSPEGKFLDINTAGVELFGYASKEKMLSIDIAKDLYTNPLDREKLKQMLIHKGYVKDYEISLRKKDGQHVIGLLTCTVVRDEKGTITAYRGIIKDITDRHRLEQQLLQAQKMEAIGQLAGGIAHDFNNILTAIIGYGQLLHEMKGDNLSNTYINHILNSAERASNLTRALLVFSRKQIISSKPVNVNTIVYGVKSLLSRLIGEDIELALFLADEDLTVMADTGQIEQVLMNLATNARDAMPDGGSLTIGTDLVQFDNEFITAHGYGKPGFYALISFEDTGQGMNEMTRERIFDPFFTTKEIGKGTGLGLAMSYGIIKQHDGYINVYSERGKGTIFKIYLPLIMSTAEEAMETEVPPIKGGTETVLVAEDDADVRELIKEVLDSFGYKVIEAQDGEDAVKVYNENKDKVQLLILDVIMPKKNGKDVYDEIRQIRPHIRAIFTSGYNEDVIHKKGILEGGLDFISKPISIDTLLRKVRDVLDKENIK
jgi:PAS domain S-box-containing protein